MKQENVTPIDAMAKPTSHVIAVTPEIAKRWLALNTANRPLNSHTISKYARAMKAGKWTITNDDICFDIDGKLQNGQHRLHAVIRSGCTIVMTVKRNMPRGAMIHMDRGKGRTHAQNLALNGEPNASLLSSTLRQLVTILQGNSDADSAKVYVGDDEMNDLLEDRPEIRDSVRFIRGGIREKILCPPTALVVAHFLIADTNGIALASHYIEQLATRANEPLGSAILAVDSRLRVADRDKQKHATRNYIYLLIKGWNHYAADRQAKVLMMAPKAGSRFEIPKVGRWSR